MMNDALLRNVDLNLLLSFSVLMQERNVSRAAERLLVGQPGLSAALKRLRDTLGDELFVRVGRGLQPTPRALAIAPAIEAALVGIEQAIRPPDAFDPANWHGEFRVSMCDNLERAFFGPLAARLRQAAPHARLASIAADMRNRLRDLDQWLRRKIRCLYWKNWKRVRTRYRELKKLGMSHDTARAWSCSRKGYWRVAGSGILDRALRNAKLEEMGWPMFLPRYLELHR